ncbi:MAG: hypothetical protein ABEJ58_08565 [Halodesulfurarchaeum sp.]
MNEILNGAFGPVVGVLGTGLLAANSTDETGSVTKLENGEHWRDRTNNTEPGSSSVDTSDSSIGMPDPVPDSASRIHDRTREFLEQSPEARIPSTFELLEIDLLRRNSGGR